MIGNEVIVVPEIVPAQLSEAVGDVIDSTLHSAIISSSSATSATGAVVSTTAIV